MNVTILLLDGLGAGAQPDSHLFGDEQADTLGHVVSNTSVHLPNLGHFGLLRYIKGEPSGLAAGGRLQQFSVGKDTTSGHWELMGVVAADPFPLYPDGFPKDLVKRFSDLSGRGVLGNRAASGTAIIEELGARHMETGDLIVYTSADSVFQVAAHEEIVPVEELHALCQRTRDEILVGDHSLSRVIARPFTGSPGTFTRTPRRRDYSLRPPHPTLLDVMVDHGRRVLGIGKVDDIFAGKGFTECRHTVDNREGLAVLLDAVRDRSNDLIFANLVQFDSHWGHRRDPDGFARGLTDVDNAMPDLMESLQDDDLLIVTADHGCDPTHPGTDHTREFVPCLFFGSTIRPAADFGVAPMTALADTVADLTGFTPWKSSHSLRPFIARP